MKKCDKFGAILDDDELFCHECGMRCKQRWMSLGMSGLSGAS